MSVHWLIAWFRCYATIRRLSGGTADSGKPSVIYVDLHPETKFATGAELRNGRQLDDRERAPRFTADTAGSTGRSERAVQRGADTGRRPTITAQS